MDGPRLFLLSPASCGGERAKLLINPAASFDLAQRIRSAEGAPLGEIFAFLSGLYFRGKLAYASRFASPPGVLPGALVITSSRGLMAPEAFVTREELISMGDVPIDARDVRYREPLERNARTIAQSHPHCNVILLGSVAGAKYVEPLLQIFGPRLHFPCDFVGRGDMSRGGLMLRAADAGVELPYIPVSGATRHGRRPPKLQGR